MGRRGRVGGREGVGMYVCMYVLCMYACIYVCTYKHCMDGCTNMYMSSAGSASIHTLPHMPYIHSTGWMGRMALAYSRSGLIIPYPAAAAPFFSSGVSSGSALSCWGACPRAWGYLFSGFRAAVDGGLLLWLWSRSRWLCNWFKSLVGGGGSGGGGDGG